MVKRHGGSKATETAVDIGQEWLARNQEPDGRWDHGKHGGKHAGKVGDAAMTGFALLAFLGAGHTEKVGKYKENVIKGVKWLIDNQEKNGNWAPLHYTQGIVTMALGEAAGMARMPETKKAAQMAIDALDRQQNQTGPSDREAWDYGWEYDKRGGTNDSSIMAWCIMGLKSSKVGGLAVNPAAFEGCLNWLNSGQDLGNHKPTDIDPYFEGGEMAYRGTCADGKKGGGSPALMAAAGLCRMMIGGASGDSVGVAGPCNRILNLTHELIPKKYPFDMYFGYYATLLMFQKGGDHWKVWNEAMKKALTDGQVKGDGPDKGSWDPAGTGEVEGRVMSTALAILCLEVYYRYAKLVPDQ
jgi:hypothetical protein